MSETAPLNLKELADAAERLELLLRKYAPLHKGAREVLRRHQDLLQRAKDKTLVAPQQNGFLPGEMWEDGELFPLTDLCDCAAQFSLLLQGWASLAAFQEAVREIEGRKEQDYEELRKKLEQQKLGHT